MAGLYKAKWMNEKGDSFEGLVAALTSLTFSWATNPESRNPWPCWRLLQQWLFLCPATTPPQQPQKDTWRIITMCSGVMCPLGKVTHWLQCDLLRDNRCESESVHFICFHHQERKKLWLVVGCLFRGSMGKFFKKYVFTDFLFFREKWKWRILSL